MFTVVIAYRYGHVIEKLKIQPTRNSDLESYIRNTHVQEEIILFAGKKNQNKQNHTHKFQGVWLVGLEGGWVLYASRQKKHTKGSDSIKVSKDNIICNYLYAKENII